MADPQTNLRVRISADLADIKTGLASVRGDLAKFKRDVDRSFEFDRAGANFTSALRQTRTIILGVAAAMATVVAPIKAATDRADELSKAAQKVGIGVKTLSELAHAAELADVEFKGLTTGLGIFNKQLAGNEKLLKQNGIETRTATGEYRETIDVLRDLADLFARTADGPQKAALAMKLFGRSGADLIPLLNGGSKAMREAAEEANRLGITVDEISGKQAEELNDNFTRLKGVVVGLGTSLAREFLPSLIKITQGLLDAAKNGGTLAATARTLAAGLKEVIENLDILAVFLIGRLALAAIPAVITGFTALRAAILAASTAAATLRGALLLLGGPIGIAIAALAAGMYFLYQRTNQAKQAAEEHAKALRDNAEMANVSKTAALEDAKAKRIQALATLKAAQAVLEERRARLAETSGRTARGGDRGDGAALAASTAFSEQTKKVQQSEKTLDDWTRRLVDLSIQIGTTTNDADAAALSNTGLVLDTAGKTKEAVKGIVDEADLLQDAMTRALAELDRHLEQNEVGITEFFAKRRDLQLQLIDAAIVQAEHEAKTAKSSDEQSRALTQIVKLQRDRLEVGPAAAREQAKAEEDLAKQLAAVKIRLLEAEGNTSAARLAELESEFLELFKKLEAQGDVAGQALVRKLINIEAVKGQLAEFEAEAQRVLGNLNNVETSLSSQAQAGLLGVLESEKQINAERDVTLEKLLTLRERALAFMATLSADSPEAASIRAFIAELNGNIASVASSMDQFRQKTADVAIDSVTGLFMDLVEGSKSAGDALRDFVRGFVLAMAQIAARALATFLVLQLLDAIYPGLGKATAATMSAGVNHGGGIAGSGGRRRFGLSPLLFGAAPRYHAGGVAGLGPNEVPAILEKGEEVLTRTNPRHRDNVDAGGRVVVKQPIVAIGDAAVADAMAGAYGEDVVLTHVRNNWQALTAGASG